MVKSTLHHHQYSLSIFVFMLLISWNTQLVAAEFMKLKVVNLDNVLVTKIMLGTPTKSLSLALDMTSDQVWFLCGVNEGQAMPPVPLPSHDTMPAGDPIPRTLRLDLAYNLNPASSNFSYIFCDSRLCPEDFKQYHTMCNSTTLCSGPHVGSQVIMYESMDVLNMSGDHSNFTFACAPIRVNLAAGVLGLGRGKQSFVSQLGFMYDNYFSYCMPFLDTESRGLPLDKKPSGYFALGKEKSNANNNNNPETIIYTPLIDDPLLYLVEMTSVTINGTNVPIDSSVSNTTLDPNTLFTTLPPEAYQAMHDVVLAMNANTTLSSDICFNTTTSSEPIQIPSVKITFRGNSTIVLDPSAVIYVVDSTMSCLAFRMSQGHNTFGGLQQADLDVLIDLGNKTVGFSFTACAN